MIWRILFGWRTWAIVSLLVLALLAWFDLQIILAPPALRVQYTPDDAYYYFQLAKNFVRLGAWTFDSGVSVTSGFHLTNAYLLAALYAIAQPSLEMFVTLGLATSSLLALLTGGIAWLVGLRLKSAVYFLTLAWLTSTRNVAFNSVSATEWSLAVLCALLYYLAIYQWYRDTRLRVLLTLFGLGTLASLARSDFGMIPLGMCVGAILDVWLTRRRELFFQSVVGLLGAGFGVLLVFLHNFYFTGEIIQSSALMKVHWARLYPIPYLSSVSLPPSLLGLALAEPLSQIIFCLFAGATALYLLVSFLRVRVRQVRAERARADTRDIVFAAASAFTLAAYLIFYANNAAVQPWYTGVLIVPAFALVFILGVWLNERLRAQSVVRGVFALLALGIVFQNVLSFLPLSSNNAPWAYQRAMQSAGLYLAAHPSAARVGAWNGGILGYYQGGTLVNLDGLVNNDIYRHAVANSLPVYLEQKYIRFLLDYENLFQTLYMRQRGGYDDPEFLAKLKLLQVFDDGEYGYGRLALYEILR